MGSILTKRDECYSLFHVPNRSRPRRSRARFDFLGIEQTNPIEAFRNGARERRRGRERLGEAMDQQGQVPSSLYKCCKPSAKLATGRDTLPPG
jgi:hypothetical protein